MAGDGCLCRAVVVRRPQLLAFTAPDAASAGEEEGSVSSTAIGALFRRGHLAAGRCSFSSSCPATTTAPAQCRWRRPSVEEGVGPRSCPPARSIPERRRRRRPHRLCPDCARPTAASSGRDLAAPPAPLAVWAVGRRRLAATTGGEIRKGGGRRHGQEEGLGADAEAERGWRHEENRGRGEVAARGESRERRGGGGVERWGRAEMAACAGPWSYGVRSCWPSPLLTPLVLAKKRVPCRPRPSALSSGEATLQLAAAASLHLVRPLQPRLHNVDGGGPRSRRA